MMLLVERLQRSPHQSFASDYRTSIGFLLNSGSSGSDEEMYLELTALPQRQAVVRLTDQQGHLLMQERETLGSEPPQLIFRIDNLSAGIYYFEVTDGFYCQVKEVEIKGAN